jgi:hypothetical protein
MGEKLMCGCKIYYTLDGDMRFSERNCKVHKKR